MKHYRDIAIILRTQPLGEADRILTLLTRHGGLVRAVAKGVRRTKSRFGARLEPFNIVDIQLYRGRNLDTVTQVETITAYGTVLASDYDRYTAATVMAELALHLCADEPATVRQFLLLHGALNTLAQGAQAWQAVIGSYLIRALTTAGWAPALDHCAQCARPVTGGEYRFSTTQGGVVCATCATQPGEPIAPAQIAVMGVLARGEWDQLANLQPDYNVVLGLLTEYAQYHVERRIKAVPIMARG